jgi:hypothetical protein
MRTHPVLKSLLLGGALFLFSILLPALFHPSEAWAQSSAVTGTVADSSGAAVPGASVKVHNTGTGVDTATVTNGAGVYRVNEPPGVYDVRIQKSGFKVAAFSGITLTVEQVLTLNATLEVGAVTQVIEVSGQSVAPIDLETGQISNVVEQRAILDMPLITRDPYSLVLLSPGVISSTTRFGGFSANGTREKDNNFLLDGVDNNDTDVPGGGSGLSPLNPDSTQEFRVITNNFAAEYGRNNGAIIDVITKSGTNQIHGDLYWFGRYDVTGARDFFNHQPDTPKNPYERNIFGASAGGPIRKDKTFWFANYEGNRFITTLTNVSSVPNAAFRTGMFNAIDPDTGASVPIDVSTADAANNGIGLPPDPTIQKILALYPTPNGPAIDNATGEYFFPSSDRFTSDNFTIKIDHHIGDKNTLSGRYNFVRYHDPNQGNANFLPPDLGAVSTSQRVQNLSLDWTSTLLPNLVNDFRIGGNRTNFPFSCVGTSVFDSFGALDPFGRGSDYILSDSFGAGPSSFGCIALGDLDKEARYTGTYHILDSLTWVRGKHSLKFGWEGRDVYSNSYDDFGSRTTVSFAPEYQFGFGVLQGLDNYPGIENDPLLNDEVAMLLGFVTTQSQSQFFDSKGVRNADDLRGFRQREMGLYAQDAWKVRPNLTFNYGVRWEYYGVPFEVHSNFSNLFMNPSGPAPFTFSIVGPGASRPAWNNEYLNFEPRVGFAWDPFKNGKTSIRAAYGIFHDRVYGNLFENARANPPFQEPFSANPFGPVTGLAAPATVPTSATVVNYDPATGLGGFVFPDLFDPNLHSPYSQNWNFGIERQITDSLQLEVNYVGVRGLRLFRYMDGNPPQPGLVKSLEAYCKDPTNAYGCVDSATASTLTGYNLYLGEEFGTLPYDAVYNNAFEENCCTPGAGLNKSIAKSYYNGLQVKVTQRFSHSVQIQGAYTWSHSMDNASDPLDAAQGNRTLPRNSFRLNAEYGDSDFDVRQRASINFVYQPNIGRGRAYLNHGIAGRIMEGWELSGITTFQTGQPYDIFGYRDSQHTGLSDRPMVVGSTAIPAGSPRIQTGPPVTAFALAPYDQASNLSRNKFYGPGINNWNTALMKDQALGDRVKLQLRFEFYNLFNRVQLGQPVNTIASVGTFGTSDYQVGEPDGTTGARQIQFALKLIF